VSDEANDVPEGAAVFPLIPAELGAHPLLLGVLHAVVFLEGSGGDVVNGDAANEALEYLATYLQRLSGNDLRRAREDMHALLSLAKHEKWPRQSVQFLKTFLADYGVGEPEDS
jgi:hypothetical protein